MIIYKKESVCPFDVDETLILHDSKPVSAGDAVMIKDPLRNRVIQATRHHAMIRLLEEEHHRGSLVVVWSRGGYEWAANVIEALGLTDKVDLVLTKPMVYFDDIPIQEWLTNRVYLKPGTHYKK